MVPRYRCESQERSIGDGGRSRTFYRDMDTTVLSPSGTIVWEAKSQDIVSFAGVFFGEIIPPFNPSEKYFPTFVGTQRYSKEI
jgi:hypothetical protein